MNLLVRPLARLARPVGAKMTLPVRLSAWLVFPALLGACAQAPKSTVVEAQFAALSCAELAVQTEDGRVWKAAADQAKSDSWHAVVPFIVAARYGRAAFSSNEAQKHLTSLGEQSTRLGCVH